MKVYEFWMERNIDHSIIEGIMNSFTGTGVKFLRKFDNVIGGAVYSLSYNENTGWTQILVDDNVPEETLTAIEARIGGLKDDEPFRKYSDDTHNESPVETPKHFSLERVLRVRQKQKDGTLGRIKDVA